MKKILSILTLCALLLATVYISSEKVADMQPPPTGSALIADMQPPATMSTTQL